MESASRVTALVGSYRKGGVVDRLVDEVLASARDAGAMTTKIYLIDRHIEFCTNCRTCTQEEGTAPGACVLEDDLRAILDEIRSSDGIVLASPMNFGTVTAVTKRFIERLLCTAYWPWGRPAPRARDSRRDKKVVLVASSAAPAILSRLTTGMIGLMKTAARLMGGRVIGVVFAGLSAQRRHQPLCPRAVRKARRLGRRLVKNQ
ncbi:MAG TPA: flavodoxin family protein [Candidatus Hydrogenedentes bacterium]|nr:flavodoxin family protein [Candidatus Hydrogenedentota bacterium]HNT89835.1 flavodoxin family protein [Candidatus Hydrogenedentota bacterium]